MRQATLYTARMAAQYLGISELAVRKNKHLTGIEIHPRLTLYTQGELDWYKREGVGPGVEHSAYPHLAAEAQNVKATFLTGKQVAAELGISEQAVQKNMLLQHVRYTFPGYEKISLWRRDAIAFYKLHPPRPGKKDVAGYWANYSPIGE